MRKIIFIPFLFVALAGFSQTRVGSYATFAGAASDLTAVGQTKSYVLELVNYSRLQAVDVDIFTDYTSGKQKLYYRFYWSNDGVNFSATAADSAASTIHAGDKYYSKTLTPCGGRYLKVAISAIDSTQVAKIYGYAHAYLK